MRLRGVPFLRVMERIVEAGMVPSIECMVDQGARLNGGGSGEGLARH